MRHIQLDSGKESESLKGQVCVFTYSSTNKGQLFAGPAWQGNSEYKDIRHSADFQKHTS